MLEGVDQSKRAVERRCLADLADAAGEVALPGDVMGPPGTTRRKPTRPTRVCRVAPVARMRAVVPDCPDPRALADFYRRLVGGELTYADDDWSTCATENR